MIELEKNKMLVDLKLAKAIILVKEAGAVDGIDDETREVLYNLEGLMDGIKYLLRDRHKE